jgi:hypothetical protein
MDLATSSASHSSQVGALKDFEDAFANSSVGWVVVGFIWLSFSTVGVGIYPLWESRATIAHVSKAMWRDITGKALVQVQAEALEDSDSQPDVAEKGVSGKDTGAAPGKVDV